jgi:hypothetical protein
MILAALDEVHSENLTHYNAPCPHCRRMNRISPKELKRSAPDWTPELTKKESSEED